MIVDDAFDNLVAAIQVPEDFINGGIAGDTKLRRNVLSNLLIDAYIRLGDITLFREDIMGAIESFRKAVELCKEFSDGNERILASTLFTIGCCFQQVSNNTEAQVSFSDSIEALRTALFLKLAANKQAVPENPSTDSLLKPSIFDSEEIKDLRGILQDMVFKHQETVE